MPRGSRLAAALVAAGAVLAVSGWGSSAQVRHATVPLGKTGPGGVELSVDVWRDPGNGEFAFRFHGADDRGVLRGRSLAYITSNHLDQVGIYSTVVAAWAVVDARYGLTAARANAALDAGDSVDRPSLMTVPKADWSNDSYAFSRDYGTDVSRLRRAARFAVPSPGKRIDGLVLADASLDRFRGPGETVDSGYVATIVYSSDPSGVGVGARELLLDVAAPGLGFGSSYATSFGNSRNRIVGPGYDARIVSTGDVILSYHGSYVLVRPDGNPTDRQLRALLGRIGRS